MKAEYILKPNKLIKTPLISVVLPTYRRADSGLLQRAIDSVLNQTWKQFELIVVDDGSVDSTQDVLKQYVKRDSRIIYVRNSTNCGLPALRVNQGLLMARGKYIAYQFDDDQWVSDALEKLYTEIEKHKEPCMVYGSYKVLNVAINREYVIDKKFDFYNMAKGNYIANNSVLHSREILDMCGMYDPHLFLRRVCDWDLWMRFSKKVPIYHIPDVVSVVETRHSDSLAEIFPYDMGLYRKYITIYRDMQLIPQEFPSYLLNDKKQELDFGEKEPEIYRQHFLKWDSIHDKVRLPQKKIQGIIYLVKAELDASASIMVENYHGLLDEYQIVYLPVNELEKTEYQSGDIIILCRILSLGETKVIERLKKKYYGLTVIYALDDNLFVSHKRGNKFQYLAPSEPCYKALEHFSRKSDCCVVPNQYLKEVLLNYNSNVWVCQTNIRKEFLPQKGSYKKAAPFKIFFAGGITREEEFRTIEEDLFCIAEKYRDKIEFTFLGYIPEKMRDLTISKVIFVPFSQSYYQYLHFISNQKYNLLICPLGEDEFKNAKSPIKVLECCCSGAIGLYSDVKPYSCITDGKDGFKIKAGASWFEKIEEILGYSQEKLSSIFDNSLSLVEEYFLTETQTENFRKMLLSAQFAGFLFIAGDMKQERAEELYKECLRFAEIGVPIKVATVPRIFQRLSKRIGENSTLEFLPLYKDIEADTIDNFQTEFSGVEFQKAMKESGLVYSFGCHTSIGMMAEKADIPYIADVSLCAKETSPQSWTNANKLTAIVSRNIDKGVQWETALGVPYLYFFPKEYDQNVPEAFIYTAMKKYMDLFVERKEKKNALTAQQQIASGITKKDPFGKKEIESEMLSLSRPLFGNRREYRMFVDRDRVKGIALIFESKKNGDMDCEVKLELLYRGAVLRTSTRRIHKEDYNQWVMFSFPLLIGCGGNEFLIRLTLDNNKASSAILSVFEDKRNRKFFYKVFNKLGLKPKGSNTLYADYIVG